MRIIFFLNLWIMFHSSQNIFAAFKSIEKIKSFQSLTARKYALKQLPIYADYIEAYYFTNKLNDSIVKKFYDQALAQFNDIDQFTYPRFTEKIVADFNPARREHKIIIILAELNINDHVYKGIYTDLYKFKYNRDIITININALKTYQLKEHFSHELSHLIRNGYQQSEKNWLQEGLAKFIEYYLNPMPLEKLYTFSAHPHVQLTFDYISPLINNYTNNFMFIYYLYSHFGGMPLIKEILKNKEIGIKNINHSLAIFQKKEDRVFLRPFYTFNNAFINYQLALFLNPYNYRIKSFGFFDLKMGIISPYLCDWGVQAELIGDHSLLKLEPFSSRYINLQDIDCITKRDQSNYWYLFINGSKANILEIKDNELICLDKMARNTLIIINTTSYQTIVRF